MVNAGYASVSFFILLSGFVLGYNYNARARAGELETNALLRGALHAACIRFTCSACILAFKMLPIEWEAHTHGMFWAGMVLSPLLLQGWIPEIATFLNTPAWTMSAESFYYVLFPVDGAMEKPGTHRTASRQDGSRMDARSGSRNAVYHLPTRWHRALDRFSYGKWLQALKYTPLPHLASFVFGVLLAELDEIIPRMGKLAPRYGYLRLCGDLCHPHAGLPAPISRSSTMAFSCHCSVA